MYAESTVIYADILFLINFSLDFICLFISGRLNNCGGRLWRMILAAFAGGLYSFLPYFFDFNGTITFILHILSAGLLCFMAFGFREIKRFFLVFGAFIASAALLGGLITGIYNLSNRYSNGLYSEISATSFGIICLVSVIIALLYGLISKRNVNTKRAEIRFFIGKEKFDALLLVDSGNLVTEPFSALPVIILSSTALPIPYNDPESETFPLAVRAIPFNTSAGKGCFLGFRPDRIELLKLGKKPKRIEAYIGIDTFGNSYSGFDGLIPASIL